ncbi:MAG: bifunctional demethylmenaquinone methyltransferase/2-methoxy-6-polyprenyl-1,4-benzoquinol methylase UbiE [Planctomycetes bacterium]|nr:bifunctional demethylmenaquinone methyltransferase/2-methoxy-6-polyprenyl-1,4-benzoquinol methylase UbiE [Planctomycetota bacterium]
MPEPTQVRSMFSRIAGIYDLLNRVLSLGIDQRWRRLTVRRAGELSGALVVDACCGTGDLSVEFARKGAQVIGVDFTREMVARAPRKLEDRPSSATFIHGDALCLPVPDHACDVASVAFGIRNVADPDEGLRELRRVLKPEGRVLVLEFTTPPGRVLGGLYKLYFTKVLPLIGRLLSRDREAYEYLPRTVLAWPNPEDFQQQMEAAGFQDCGYQLLTGGIACLHWGDAPA